MPNRAPNRGATHRKTGPDRLALYQRAQEAIEFLIECNGHTTLTKDAFATTMASRYGRKWLRMDGRGNRRMVEEVMNLTRDQDIDQVAASLLGGFVVAYAPNLGGMTLIDPTGEVTLDHQLHMLSGDLQRQQATKTINRRRIAYWKAAGECAMRAGDFKLGRLLSQVENEVNATGFVSDNLVAEYMAALGARGLV